jgi:hypothetical protein
MVGCLHPINIIYSGGRDHPICRRAPQEP